MPVPHVTLFGFYYFLAIASMFAICVGCVFLSKKKGPEFTHKLILWLVWINFALHFLKQFLPLSIQNWPDSLMWSGSPNLCAFIILFGPFLYISKNKYLRDYFFYIGVASGLLVYFWPTTAIERTDLQGMTYILECVRFYFCHLVIVVAPLLMVTSRLHTLRFKRLWAVPLLFGAVLFVVSIHCAICGPILHDKGFSTEWFGPNGVFTRFSSNESMQFGPQVKLDKAIGFIYPFYFPYLLSYTIDGTTYFVPVLWILPIIYLGTYLLGPIAIFLVDPKGSKLELIALRQRIKMHRNARQKKC